MASERAMAALKLRQSGATFVEIAKDFRITPSRARQLVLAALRSEPGFRRCKAVREAALASAHMACRCWTL
jgi:hypothetical protein